MTTHIAGWSGRRTDICLYKITILRHSRSACMHPCTLPLVLPLLGRTWPHAMFPPLPSPSSCLIWGLSSVSVTQDQRPCSFMALTEPGLTRRDRLSHVAGDAPLACCLSLHLTAVSWMQPDNGQQRHYECPFFSVTLDARVQEHYSRYSCSSLFIYTLWCQAGFVTCCATREWEHQWLFVDLFFIQKWSKPKSKNNIWQNCIWLSMK